MKTFIVRLLSLSVLTLALCSCSRFGAVYPPRPAEAPGAPVADPAPSKLVAHVSVTGDALRAALDGAVPATGEGTFPLLGGARQYTWTRQPLGLRFSQGRLVLAVHVDARVSLPLQSLELPLDLEVAAEPVVNRDYAVKLQSVDVKVSSTDKRLAVANAVAGVYDSLGRQVTAKLQAFSYDLRPMVEEAYSRVARPVKFPVGQAEGCARVKVLEVEAAPNVLSDGLTRTSPWSLPPR
jgi:hypothetical protein